MGVLENGKTNRCDTGGKTDLNSRKTAEGVEKHTSRLRHKLWEIEKELTRGFAGSPRNKESENKVRQGSQLTHCEVTT